MPYTTLISTETLAQHLDAPDWVIVDCRFSLADTELGRRQYRAGHIPGAVYAHLDEDLSGTLIPGKTSRHPLPPIDTLAQTLSNWGIGPQTQVVAYDSLHGAIAARLWWMLRWLGHTAAAVLDGGWPRWEAEQRPVSAQIPTPAPQQFTPHLHPEMVVDTATVMQIRTDPDWRVVDSRTAERYRGEAEPIDPVAGHIPGAISLPYPENMAADGTFLPAETLQARFRAETSDVPIEKTVFYCGSGVTGAHNVLAAAHAGLGQARLYAGSWSEWITDPDRPIATGRK